jgi:hypothetical protein
MVIKSNTTTWLSVIKWRFCWSFLVLRYIDESKKNPLQWHYSKFLFQWQYITLFDGLQIYTWSLIISVFKLACKDCEPCSIKSTFGKFYGLFNDWLIDWLIIYGFTPRSRIFDLYGDVTTAGEGLQNLGLCSALRAFEQGTIFIMPHLLWHGTSVFRSHPKDLPI